MGSAGYGHVHDSAADIGLHRPTPISEEDSFRVVARTHVARGDVDGAMHFLGKIPEDRVELIDELVTMLLSSGLRDQAVHLMTVACERAVDYRARALLVVSAARFGLEKPVRDRIAAVVDKHLEKDPARMDEAGAIIAAAVAAGQDQLVDRVLEATAKQLTNAGLKSLSSMLLAEGYAEVSLQVYVAKAKQHSSVTMIYLMDMLRAADRPADADRLFVRVLAADPSRAPTTLMAMRNIGRISQADRLFTEVGEYSAAAGVRLCVALADQPREYTDCVLGGLARHSLDTLITSVSADSDEAEKAVLHDVLLTRSPAEVAAAANRMASQGGKSGVDVLMSIYAHAPMERVLDCAVTLIRGSALYPVLELLGEFAAHAGTAGLISAASVLAQTDIDTFRTLIYIAFTRSDRVPELIGALRRDGRFDAALSHLRDLVVLMTAEQFTELSSNLIDQGAEELFDDLARTASERSDFNGLISNLHAQGHHRIAYRLQGYSIY